MQLDAYTIRQASGVGKTLLRVAKRRNITSHFGLAKAIGVDESSVDAILRGGQPNARTAKRYRKYIKRYAGKGDITDSFTQVVAGSDSASTKTATFSSSSRTEKAIVKTKATAKMQQQAKVSPAKLTSIRSSALPSALTRRPSMVDAPTTSGGISLVRQIEQLRSDIGSAVEMAVELDDHVQQVVRLRDRTNEVVHRVRSQASQLLSLAQSWEKDPFIKEVLSADPSTRRVLAQVLKLANPNAPLPSMPGRPKGSSTTGARSTGGGRKTPTRANKSQVGRGVKRRAGGRGKATGAGGAGANPSPVAGVVGGSSAPGAAGA